MAAYVLLAFDDDEDAKEFVIDALYDGVFKTHTNYITDKVVVRAVYKKPVMFCNCSTHTDGWTRGKRFGWWACAKCGKPGEAWAKGFAWYTALGTNLLPREICGEAPQPAGWESPDQWNFLIKKTEPVEDTAPTAAIESP